MKSLVVKKSNKGNSVVLIDRDVYVNHKENILEDNLKFEKVDMKTKTLNFQVNHKKRINEILKSLASASSLGYKQYKKIKAVGSRPGVYMPFVEFTKQLLMFVYLLDFASGKRTYKIFKFLVPIVNCLTINEFTATDSFSSVKEIVEQDNSFYMGSLDVNSLFTNIPLDENINICTESIYDQNDAVGLNKSELKELLSLVTKEPYFVFNEFLYKQLAMGSPSGPTLANAFLCFYEKKWLEQCHEEFKPVYYRGYIDDIFVLFRSRDHIFKFRDYLNKYHPNIKFSFEEEKNGKLSFLDVELSQEGNQFVTTVYRKPTFSDA